MFLQQHMHDKHYPYADMIQNNAFGILIKGTTLKLSLKI